MSRIGRIRYALGLSRIEMAKGFSKSDKNLLCSMPEVESLAKKHGVYLRFSPSETKGATKMSMYRNRIDHVADVPEIAWKNNTGDSVYISWKENLGETDVIKGPESILDAAKKMLGL